MVSLRIILHNLLQFRKFPRCVVSIGKGTTSVPYIITSERSDRVTIGKYCSIGHGVTLITHPGHLPPKGFENRRVATYPVARILNHGFLMSYYLPEKRNFVFIGNDVCIGANVIVLPGVKIGDGAIVGAGSVVTTDVPPYAIVAGIPSRVLRYRYSPKQIEKLLQIAWWNWGERKIYENMDYFYAQVDAFIEKFCVPNEKPERSSL
ncbi:MAG TPA: CatB-related O-acetyltransferase [Candidatus Binatia bacterium]|nr:CatB-related O-acetyltransferase [Candidatus Binatia bacterium]